MRLLHHFRALSALICYSCVLTIADEQPARFLTFAQVEDILRVFGRTEDASAWNAWIRQEDREVRARIGRGVEDSISNLVLYGTTFTKLARLSSPESAVNAAGELIEPARDRVRAAAAALAHPSGNERLQFARDYLLRRGVAEHEFGRVLESNLARFGVEQRDYQERLRAAHQQGDPGEELFVRSTLFDTRGLSVDTSLLPNYALEDTLRAMMRKNALAPGSIRNIAVIGPGLDFTDKRDGYDFYPLQTIQPYAVLEAVLRLDLGRPDSLRVTTLDLNPAVNAHIDRAIKRAREGTPYVIQLPRDVSAGWTPQAVSYWEHFGELIGSAVPPVPSPNRLAVRAVAVQPKYASMIEPLDLNVVAQVLAGRTFDLVVATNILVYYDRLHQTLAMASIAEMMNPGGVFLSNTVLPAQRPAGLEYLGRRSLSYSLSGDYGDDVVVYRRK